MKRTGIEVQARRIVTVMLTFGLTAAAGAGLAAWAVDDTNAFYMEPIAQYGTPAYARRQPVADTFWETQDRGIATSPDQAGFGSTAISAQPTYRSASGS